MKHFHILNKFIFLCLLCIFLVPMKSRAYEVYHGLVSWYGPGFHSRLTANGEHYDMFGFSAAHRELPFNTLVEVYNKKNKRKCIIRVNDRGPVSPRLLMDLSYGAAMAIDSQSSGTANAILTLVGDKNGIFDKKKAFFIFLDDIIILPKKLPFKDWEIDNIDYYLNIAGSIEIIKLMQKHLKRLYQSSVYNATDLLVSIDKNVCLGPYKNFQEAENIYHKIATLYPHASIWLENKDNAKSLIIK